MKLPAFRRIEEAINEAARKFDQFGRALDGLINRGPMTWIEEMSKDEKEDLNRQIRLLEELMRRSQELKDAMKEAKRALEKTEERLTPKQRGCKEENC
jgi:vacuolar-type H+-ATPase subunit H